MHKFLRSIGFSNVRKRDLEIVLKDIIDRPEFIKITKDSEGNEFAELSRSFCPNVGVTVRGIYLEDDSFEMEYYFPYMLGTSITTQEQIEVEKHAEKESYAGVCDELNLGVTLIFYLQNVADYLSEKSRYKEKPLYGAMLAGLSTDGKILMPIQEGTHKEKAHAKKHDERNQLIAQAREGDEEAIESLTLDDMDTYAIISKRVMTEDILSIVRSTFMPYGIESDQYSILGEIVDFTKMENNLSHEKSYGLKVLCNDIIFDVCIHEDDLLGEPEIGRRFKGDVWMQGSLCMD